MINCGELIFEYTNIFPAPPPSSYDGADTITISEDSFDIILFPKYEESPTIPLTCLTL
jgi:hypothetical protein